jgi:hypothetical protein
VGRADLIIPPTVSRHFLYPVLSSNLSLLNCFFPLKFLQFKIEPTQEEDVPFAYLLHAALKQDGSAAIVRLA